jgi:membrane protein DedA with SNARE-associated domain
MPLEIFVFVGSIIEEIIWFIPSPFIMTSAALLAVKQDYSIFAFASLILFATLGKTVSSYIVFILSEKLEELAQKSKIKFIPDKKTVHKWSEVISQGPWDDIILTIIRAIPIIPSFPVSVACGLLNISTKTFLITTIIGTYIRYTFYAAAAVIGFNQLKNIEANFILLGLIAAFVCALVIFYLHRDKFSNKLISILNKKPKKNKKPLDRD